MKRFGAVVVLFKPSGEQLDHLRRVKDQCADLVAVDNSPEPDPGLPARLQAEGIETVANRNRGGVAGGFNRGIEVLEARGCEVFFYFDQDSQLPDGYFAAMLRVGEGLQDPRFILAPRIFDVHVGRYLDSFITDGWRARRVRVGAADGETLRCSFVISSGCAVSAAARRELGPMREDYFIDHVDSEYCFRALARSVPVYITTAVTLRHQIGERVKHRFLYFFEIGAINHVPARRYYMARNAVHMVCLYGRRLPAAVMLMNLLTLSQIVAVACFETGKRRKLAAMLLGLWDGLHARLGTLESLHPRTLDRPWEQ
ncbi:MAG: glycosyltransferase family 2 protein [Nevskia sp.]|nr:glycosyltransferase family 2 protein [Nevskia sp.]